MPRAKLGDLWKKPVQSREQRLALEIVRSFEHVAHEHDGLFKEHGLSGPQYNVLRILRGAGPDGLPCQGIGERMVSRVPDITRLVDRLERAGYVTRERDPAEDRRKVFNRITRKGLELLALLDQPLLKLHRRQFKNLNRDEMLKLEKLLLQIRG